MSNVSVTVRASGTTVGSCAMELRLQTLCEVSIVSTPCFHVDVELDNSRVIDFRATEERIN